MPRKGHTPEQVLNKLRQVEVAVAGGKSVGHAGVPGDQDGKKDQVR